jgi:hypothetical protein
MGDRATIEAVLGQVQLRRAAPQPHIQRPVCPEGVLRFDFEPEPGVPRTARPRVSYVQDRGHALHCSPLVILGLLAWYAEPVYREVQRAERVARQLACKTFDQMAGELKA